MDYKVMGKILKILFVIFLLIIITANCYAVDSSSEYDKFLKIVPDEYSEMSQQDVYKQLDFGVIVSKVLKIFLKSFDKAIKLTLSLLGLIILYSIINKSDISETSVKNMVFSAFSITIVAISIGSVEDCIETIKECVDSAKVFSSAAIPIILSLCVASASSFSGAVFSTSVSFITVMMETVSKHLLIPLTVIYLLFALINNLSSYINLVLLQQQIKKFIKWVIGSFIALFSFTMTLQNFLSATSDSVLKRSIKSAVGSFVPIVGSTLSSSIDSIFTIASGTKTTISVLGILVIFFIFLPALSVALCYGLSLSASKFLAHFLNEDKIAGTIGIISDVFYLLSAICSACIVMMVLSFLMICLNIG